MIWYIKPMKKLIFTALCTLVLSAPAVGQGLKTLAGNTLMGTANGAMLGLGTMALLNDANAAPLRVGIGMGTLYGLGLGVYDVSVNEIGAGYSVEGMFNNADYTGMIVLLDTFYGGVTGGVVGTAMALMANKPLIDGLQYGVGAGIWGGFAFGLVDAFYFSKSVPSVFAQSITIDPNDRTSIQFIQPNLYTSPIISNGRMGITSEIALDLARVTIRL